MAKKPTLTEAVLTGIGQHRSGKCRTWFDKLTNDDHKAELLEIRRAWQAGEVKSPAAILARHIASSLKALGVSGIGEQGVTNWLKRND